jgi:hypothetical protein
MMSVDRWSDPLDQKKKWAENQKRGLAPSFKIRARTKRYAGYPKQERGKGGVSKLYKIALYISHYTLRIADLTVLIVGFMVSQKE